MLCGEEDGGDDNLMIMPFEPMSLSGYCGVVDMCDGRLELSCTSGDVKYMPLDGEWTILGKGEMVGLTGGDRLEIGKQKQCWEVVDLFKSDLGGRESVQKKAKNTDLVDSYDAPFLEFVPGLTYSLIVGNCFNDNGCSGSPSQVQHPRAIERCRTAALYLVHAKKKGDFVGVPREIVLLLAFHVYATRNEQQWQLEASFVHLAWSFPASSGPGSYSVMITLPIPVTGSKDLEDWDCSCPLAEGFDTTELYCKHVRDCLLEFEDTEASGNVKRRSFHYRPPGDFVYERHARSKAARKDRQRAAEAAYYRWRDENEL